jgi:aspartokinase/homoserine dehydrogenase 1
MMSDEVKTLVMKFGGTSVGSAPAIRSAAEIALVARRNWDRVVVVVSAMAGITDLLLESVRKAILGDATFIQDSIQSMREKHISVLDELATEEEIKNRAAESIEGLLQQCGNLLQAVSVLGEATPRAMDAIAGIGERISARLLSAILEDRGTKAQAVDATQLIVTDNRFMSAHPDYEASRERIHQVLVPVLQQGRIAVVTGFIAATPDGVTTTLGRGGSDYSAAIIGALLDADQVWIWTDVNGVMSADPRLVPGARTIPELSYREIAELAFYGAKVVHPKTIRPVIEAGIELRVRNTFDPSGPGTWLVAHRSEISDGAIRAVTAIKGQALITIEGRGMLGVPGVAARTFGAVAATGTSVPLITQASSEQSICFAIPMAACQQVVGGLEREFAAELKRRDIDRIWATEEVVIITIVGAGMRDTPGIAGRIFGALGERGINVIAIAQGSSEVSISLVLEAADAQDGLEALHELTI